MKNLILTLALCLSMYQVEAQKTVNFSGQIKNANPEELIYLGLEEFLLPLKVMEDGTFTINANIEKSPSFFYLAE